MAYIVEADVVKYGCTCGILRPISRLYFCRHCLELRCTFCVCHEIDSLFCGKCLENMPSSEARLKKNRCGSCLDCPSCMQQLSLRAATAGPKNPEDTKATPRKVYYLLCLNCRWSSRDVGIPDQQTTSNWPERDNVHTNRLQEVQEMFKGLVLLQKQQIMEKDKKKQRKFMSFTDRTGITAAMLRKRIGLPESPHPLAKPKAKTLEPATAKEEVEQLPADIFTKPVNLAKVTTIKQRLLLPDQQPTTVDKLFPVHKQICVKRSMRCRSCEHNVSKPEYNPASIKFKIQLFAYYHIPEIRIVTVEPLRAGKKCELLLKFINPTQYETTISLLPVFSTIKKEKPEEQPCTGEEKKSEEENNASSLEGWIPNSLLPTKSHCLIVEPRMITQDVTADMELPESHFILPLRDDAAEYDDSSDSHNIQDDSKKLIEGVEAIRTNLKIIFVGLSISVIYALYFRLVVWRKSNKAVIKLHVTPKEDNKLGDEIVAAFTMEHLYTNTITSQKYQHRLNVFLVLGNLVGSE